MLSQIVWPTMKISSDNDAIWFTRIQQLFYGIRYRKLSIKWPPDGSVFQRLHVGGRKNNSSFPDFLNFILNITRWHYYIFYLHMKMHMGKVEHQRNAFHACTKKAKLLLTEFDSYCLLNIRMLVWWQLCERGLALASLGNFLALWYNLQLWIS